FKGKRTAVKVAIHFLENKNMPFDVGTDVINQATTDPRVKEAWSQDPNTRSNLSPRDRKSTRLNSSHLVISYAVFCLKKKILNEVDLDADPALLLEPLVHSRSLRPSRVLGRQEDPVLEGLPAGRLRRLGRGRAPRRRG